MLLSFQSYCSDPSLVLDLKNLIVLFADTLQVGDCCLLPAGMFAGRVCMQAPQTQQMLLSNVLLADVVALFLHSWQGYGFPVNQLFDTLLEIQDQYSETLLKKWSGVFR